MALSLERPDQGWFNLALDQAQAAQLLAPWPALRTEVEGPVDARLRGTLGREVSGTGLVALGRGRVFGLTVTEWRLPLDFYFVPRRGRGQIDIRDSTAQAASGRVTGQASFTWDVGNRLDGSLRFYGVQLQQLLQSLGSLGQSGAGLVTGRVDFAGTDVRSPDDLTADMQANFQQTQAVNIPVLSQLVQLIPGLSSGTWFTSGDLRARLAGGVVRLQRLGLKGSLVQLFVEGTINLQGRLNLDVRANTGIGVNPSLLRLIGLRLPLAGPIPAGLILEASNLLSPRLIHLRVTGTVRSPTIQFEPITLLGQEAVLFFLGRAAGAGP
jgi:translocation and assembly module TamB